MKYISKDFMKDDGQCYNGYFHVFQCFLLASQHLDLIPRNEYFSKRLQLPVLEEGLGFNSSTGKGFQSAVQEQISSDFIHL